MINNGREGGRKVGREGVINFHQTVLHTHAMIIIIVIIEVVILLLIGEGTFIFYNTSIVSI